MNYVQLILICFLSLYSINFIAMDDEIDQKLSINFTRAEKIARHLNDEIKLLSKELKSKQIIDYQPSLEEIKYEIALLETIVEQIPGFHDDVAKNIKNGRAYVGWFSLDYVRGKIKEETDKYYKDIHKKAAKKISLQRHLKHGKSSPSKSKKTKILEPVKNEINKKIIQTDIIAPVEIAPQPVIQEIKPITPEIVTTSIELDVVDSNQNPIIQPEPHEIGSIYQNLKYAAHYIQKLFFDCFSAIQSIFY